jgi:hypothetical protein
MSHTEGEPYFFTLGKSEVSNHVSHHLLSPILFVLGFLDVILGNIGNFLMCVIFVEFYIWPYILIQHTLPIC